MFFAADTPFRIGFPGAIGDRAITLRFGEELAPEALARSDGESPTSNGLLPARAMVLRNLLWAWLEHAEADEFEAEALGLDLLNMALMSVRTGNPARLFLSTGAVPSILPNRCPSPIANTLPPFCT